MKPNHHTDESIIKILEQAEKGEQTMSAFCRTRGVAEKALCGWRKVYDGISINKVQPLRSESKSMPGSSGC